MASVSISGTIKVLGNTQQVSEKFSKREVVITEAGGNYPQHIPVEFAQDRCAILDGYKQGDEVTVTCYVNGREWTGKDGVTKHFLSLRGDRIERSGASGGGNTGSYQAAPLPTAADMPPVGGTEDDDLPF